MGFEPRAFPGLNVLKLATPIYWGYHMGIMETQMEKKMEKNIENEMETGIIGFIGVYLN